MKVVFLDIDGVLNNHAKLSDSLYCGVEPRCMKAFNYALLKTDADIVLSSSWRYMVIGGEMTLKGFYYMLCTHGLVSRHLFGMVCPDEEEPVRGKQISRWLKTQKVEKYVVVDDLDLGIRDEGHPFIQTDSGVGFTFDHAQTLIRMLES